MINFTPNFSATLASMVDDNGYLIRGAVDCIERKNAYVVMRIKNLSRAEAVAKQYFGLELGGPLKVTTNKQQTCLWISPDEFLLILEEGTQAPIIEQAEKFKDALALVDNSGGYTCLQLSGEKTETLLSYLMAYDIHRALTAGKVVTTTLMQSQVVMFRLPDSQDQSIHLLVRPSFAHYVAKHLVDISRRI